ncbi:Uncharacterised protein [Mycobacterium tuberculosis]|nr:Uncharacterised protein [Mycobacterium tuberculosis]
MDGGGARVPGRSTTSVARAAAPRTMARSDSSANSRCAARTTRAIWVCTATRRDGSTQFWATALSSCSSAVSTSGSREP